MDFQSDDHFHIIEFEEWFDSLRPFVRAHEEAEIEELFEAAALGMLNETGDTRTAIKPIRSEPEVFELRRKALSKNLRFYHGETFNRELLVKLHRQIKHGKQDQDEAILHAGERFDEWYSQNKN